MDNFSVFFFFAIARSKTIAAKFRKLEKMPIDYLHIDVVSATTNSSTVKFEKNVKNAKNALGLNISDHRFFSDIRFVAVNSKLV